MTDGYRKTLLVVDDDRFFCDLVQAQFADRPLTVRAAHSGASARQISFETRIDVVLLDQKLPDMEGIALCKTIREHHDRSKIIFITAYPSFEHVVNAIRAGASDYLSKPVENEALMIAVEKALRTLELEQVEQIQDFNRSKDNAETVLIGSSPALNEIRRLIAVAALNRAPVLITGETGTGKNVVAKSIHYKDPRRNPALVGVNCAALPENLIEAELFGYRKGAFTGASADKKGLFEMADGGTLFLDEIGEMPLHLQSKLLSVLDDKKIRRIGAESAHPVDVRIIAATNADPEQAIVAKTFREDLYYRLSVIRIRVPSLKERLEDIPELARHLAHVLSPHDPLEISDAEIEKLRAYHWPGNVRELKNVIERAVMLRDGKFICPSRLLENKPPHAAFFAPADLNAAQPIPLLADVEKNHIRAVLALLQQNRTRAAAALGISRSTLMRKLKEHRL